MSWVWVIDKYIAEQLPVVPPDRYDAIRFGPKTAGEIVRDAVPELTYTAHDMASFARDIGHVAADRKRRGGAQDGDAAYTKGAAALPIVIRPSTP